MWADAYKPILINTTVAYIDSQASGTPGFLDCGAEQGGGPVSGQNPTVGWVMACGTRACASLQYLNGGFVNEWNGNSASMTCF